MLVQCDVHCLDVDARNTYLPVDIMDATKLFSVSCMIITLSSFSRCTRTSDLLSGSTLYPSPCLPALFSPACLPWEHYSLSWIPYQLLQYLTQLGLPLEDLARTNVILYIEPFYCLRRSLYVHGALWSLHIAFYGSVTWPFVVPPHGPSRSFHMVLCGSSTWPILVSTWTLCGLCTWLFVDILQGPLRSFCMVPCSSSRRPSEVLPCGPFWSFYMVLCGLLLGSLWCCYMAHCYLLFMALVVL